MQSNSAGDEQIGRTYDVFLSYAHMDAEHDVANARQIAQWLEGLGYQVWWDRALLAGEEWAATLVTKLLASRKVLVLWSANAHKSRWVTTETGVAVGQKKLLPVLLDGHPVPQEWGNLNQVMPCPFDDLKPKILAALAIAPSGMAALAAALDVDDRVRISDLPTPGGTLIGRDAEKTRLTNAWASTAPDADPARKTNVIVVHAVGGAGKTALMRSFLDTLGTEGFPGAFKVYGWSAYSQGSADNRNADADGFLNAALTFFGFDIDAHPIKDATEKGRKLASLIKGRRNLLILDGLEPLQDLQEVNNGRLKHRGMAALVKELAADNKGLLLITSRQALPEFGETPPEPRIVSRPLENLSVPEGVALLTRRGVHGRQREVEAAVAETLGHALTLNLLGSYLDTVHGGDVQQRDQFRLGEIEDSDADFIGDRTARYALRTARIMEGYVERFAGMRGKTAAGGAVETALLSVVGLFDRPAEQAAVDVVLADPVISGLTDALSGLTPPQRRARLKVAGERLRGLKLLNSAEKAGGLDAHPVVRAHFGARLKAEQLEAFRVANLRLYDHYKALPEKHLPDTLAEMQPLFAAIAHGVAAGKVQEAFAEVYYKRVQRGGDSYINTQLGAFGADLGALAHFFTTRWTTPHADLTPSTQAATLAFAGFALHALGRLRDAVAPFRASLEMSKELQNWQNASAAAGHLSQLLFSLGDLLAFGAAQQEQSSLSDRCVDEIISTVNRTDHADERHQVGDHAVRDPFPHPESGSHIQFVGLNFLDELMRLDELSTANASHQKDIRRVIQELEVLNNTSLLAPSLLDEARDTLSRFDELNTAYAGEQEEIRRVMQQLVEVGNNPLLDKVVNKQSLLTKALNSLSLGRTAHRAWLTSPRFSREEPAAILATARAHLDDAVAMLREAGSEDHIPHGLLARAALRIDMFSAGVAIPGDDSGWAEPLAGAQRDLAEVHDIAEGPGMRLHLTDYRLGYVRLILAADPTLSQPDNRRNAEVCWTEAHRLIQATGYHRCDAELARLRTRLDGGGSLA